MKRPRWKRCGHNPGILSPEDQAAVNAFLALLLVLKNPEPWDPDSGSDIAVRIGPFIERAHPRPGDDHGPTAVAVTIVDSDPRRSGCPLHTGWLRCERHLVVGTWNDAYRTLTHAAHYLLLPDQPLPPAHYAVHIARPGQPLIRIGPYTQCYEADHDARRLRQLAEHADDPGTVIQAVPFDFDAIPNYHDPEREDIDKLLATQTHARTHSEGGPGR